MTLANAAESARLIEQDLLAIAQVLQDLRYLLKSFDLVDLWGRVTLEDFDTSRRRYPIRGHCISYGLSLAALLQRVSKLIAIAREMENNRRDRIFVRMKELRDQFARCIATRTLLGPK